MRIDFRGFDVDSPPLPNLAMLVQQGPETAEVQELTGSPNLEQAEQEVWTILA